MREGATGYKHHSRLFLERKPFFEDVCKLFDAIADEQVAGFVTASSITDIFYICRRQTQSLEEAKQLLITTLSLLEICPVDYSILEIALKSGLADFEDAVQIACAEAQNLDAIITRNPKDFRTTRIAVLSTHQIVEQLKDDI